MAGRAPDDLDFWPRVTRFYGIGPDVLQTLPRNIRKLYIKQMGEIEAEEHLMALLIADYPHSEPPDRRRIHTAFKNAAGIEDAPVEQIDHTSEEGAAVLASLGIGLKSPPREEAEDA